MKKKILIVDDDVELCLELSELLESKGFVSKVVSDSYQAKDIILVEEFGTIILDFKMAHLTGLDILKNLKAKGLKRNIIMMTGRPFIRKILKKEGVESMVRAVIPKPFKINDLLEKLRLIEHS